MEHMSLPNNDMQIIERKAFVLLDQNERTLGEPLTPEKRYVMFDKIRSNLIQIKLIESIHQISARHLESHG